jgi:hypothetical protein
MGFRRLVVVVVALALGVLIVALSHPGAVAAQGESIPTLQQLEALIGSQQQSANLAKSDPVTYGWDLFFYTSWTALTGPTHRGQPDPKKKFGTGPVVWETWKNTSETYLCNGHAPAKWNTAEPIPPPLCPPSTATISPPQPSDSGNLWQDMTGNSEVDGFPAKDNQNEDLLYEIRTDKSSFDYVVKRTLYNLDGQIKYAATKGALNFDWTAMEVKASWRWLDTTQAGCTAADYFTANALWAEKDSNGKFVKWRSGLMGLTGLHIITKALPQWVWITFEQVNNMKCTQVERRDPIPQNIATVNAQMQKALAGTKWANYELVGVQTAAMDGTTPVLLANTQIETLFQSRSSCLTCHAIANIATHKPTKPEDDLRKSFVQRTPPVSPPYYIGDPPSLAPWVGQDFVWSLRRAVWFQK